MLDHVYLRFPHKTELEHSASFMQAHLVQDEPKQNCVCGCAFELQMEFASIAQSLNVFTLSGQPSAALHVPETLPSSLN